MDRAKKLRLNTIIGIISQIVTFICGFIVPRIIMTYYGSEVNGLVSSIIHFLSFISLAECGIGVVVQSSLYKPLAEKDNDAISRIIISSDRFFSKIAILLCAYVLVLLVIYPHFPRIAETSFDGLYIRTLLLTISISTFIQHYVCMSYRLLVIADQVGYVQLLLQILTQILTATISVVLAKVGSSIQLFKLSASLILALQPLLLSIYVKRHYSINKKLTLHEEPIKQKWNGLAQHIAYVVLNNTDIVVLTMMSSLVNVSIYNAYFLVVNGIKTLITSIVTGMQSLLGNMYANNEKQTLLHTFSLYEGAIHLTVTFLYSCTCALIVPFVSIYTKDVPDANYIEPLFGILISLAQMAYCIRLPYNAMIFAAGHYKQTQLSAILEAVINIIVSVVLVSKFGLVGVAIGTLAAMIFRTTYLAIYLTKNILYRNIRYYIKHLFVDGVVILFSLISTSKLNIMPLNYTEWVVDAIKVALMIGSVSVIVTFIAYPSELKTLVHRIKQKVFK